MIMLWFPFVKILGFNCMLQYDDSYYFSAVTFESLLHKSSFVALISLINGKVHLKLSKSLSRIISSRSCSVSVPHRDLFSIIHVECWENKWNCMFNLNSMKILHSQYDSSFFLCLFWLTGVRNTKLWQFIVSWYLGI